VNFPYLIDTQSRHIAWVIAWALQHDATEVEATSDAEAAWVDSVVQRSSVIAGRRESCTPGYYNREGHAEAKLNQDSFFFGSPTEYADILDAWRAAGKLDGLDVRESAPSGHTRQVNRTARPAEPRVVSVSAPGGARGTSRR
jgi:hypothetical protein